MLTVTQMLRKKGVVGRFVEFYGPGLDDLSLADRATIGNMAPEYGATCGFFPIDEETMRYLAFTGRDKDRVALVEAYAKAQGMWRDASTPDPVFTDTLELDLSTVEPSLAGPKRPQDRVALTRRQAGFDKALPELAGPKAAQAPVKVGGANYDLAHGDVVIAAITIVHQHLEPVACWSAPASSRATRVARASRPSRGSRRRWRRARRWSSTISMRPACRTISTRSASTSSATAAPPASATRARCRSRSRHAIEAGDLTVAAVLSGNRNFEGRIHPFVKANYLASPPLVVAYALAGTMLKDLTKEPLGEGSDGKPVYLKDIWPTSKEVADTMNAALTPDMFRKRYANVFKGDELWQTMGTSAGLTYKWAPAARM